MAGDTVAEILERLREPVARSIYEAQVQQARKLAATYDTQFDRIKRVLNVAGIEADRSASILIFALAEDLMLQCFRANFNPKPRGGWDAITEGHGVLATASDRITMLELLQWVSPEVIADLRLLKSIRNRFAHHADVEGFEDKKILGWVTSLSPVEKRITEALGAEMTSEWRKLTPREIFLTRAACVVFKLAFDLAVGPAAVKAGVNFADVAGATTETELEATTALIDAITERLNMVFPPR